MKRYVLILLAVFLLCGCSAVEPDPTDIIRPAETIADTTETPVPWVAERGMAWDREGVLLEIPLTIPDGLHYSCAVEFNGDLLLWSLDNHLMDVSYLELCLIDLDDGSVIVQRDVEVSDYVYPRAVGEYLYICDSFRGSVYKLSSDLQTISMWNMDISEETVYVSANDTVYLYDSDMHLIRYDLNTGNRIPVLEGDPEISWIHEAENSLTIKYYLPTSGAPAFAILDLITDECRYAPVDDPTVSTVRLLGNSWLYEKYLDGYIYTLHTEGTAPLRLALGESNVTFLKEGYLMESTMDSTALRLFELDGTWKASCTVFESGNGYIASDMIWNEYLGGYFFVARTYDEVSRLLFWNMDKVTSGDDLKLEPYPEPDAVQAQLEARAGELEEKFGVTILVGNQCDTQYDEFSATLATDFDRVNLALDTLEEAFSAFPEGFIRQLRYGYIQGIRVQLISDLQADGSGRTGGGYNAFTQPQFDYYLMVIDVDDSYTQTYYHEMSHIIDSYLAWDAMEREDALFSEQRWADLNPRWFDGYSFDYSIQQDLEDYTSFIDSYATISPTEDRARVLEYAMYEYGMWSFDDSPILQNKLEYYCRCIRDAFDTSLWPDSVRWEQFLDS